MIPTLKPYPKYKDSGVPWLGKVPEHWEVVRLGSLFRERGETNEAGQATEVLSVLRDRGVIPYSEKGNIGNKKSEDITRYKIVRPGDIVVNCMNVIIGSVGISRYEGCLSPVYYVLTPRSRRNNPQYLNACFQTKPFQRSLVRIGNGILAHRMRIPMELLKCEPLPRPPSDEQTAIVRFLDWAERRIRRVIRLRNQRIELLEEYKQALIHRAVTGQIDVHTGKPYPKYKDSGVEWLGDVPEHWEVCRLKSRLVKNDSGVWNDQRDADGTIVLRSTEQTVSGGWKIQNPARLRLSAEERRAFLLKNGDLVVTKSSGSPDHIGKTSLVTEEIERLDCAFSNFMQRLRLDRNTIPKLVWYYLNAPIGREQLVFQSTTTTGLGNLNATILGNCRIAIPSLSEQTAIVEFLDEQTERIDAAIAADRRAIDLLKEFRTRLIADVVTGKLDVREIAVKLPDELPDEEAAKDVEPESEIDLETVSEETLS